MLNRELAPRMRASGEEPRLVAILGDGAFTDGALDRRRREKAGSQNGGSLGKRASFWFHPRLRASETKPRGRGTFLITTGVIGLNLPSGLGTGLFTLCPCDGGGEGEGEG